MTELKIKHLEFVQGVITRMNANAFMLKGWAVTLVAAVFALAAKDSDQRFVLVAYIPIVLFEGLDAYYLALEKRFRKLFDAIVKGAPHVEDFSMDASRFNKDDATWIRCLVSSTVLPFYMILTGIVLIAMFLLRK